MMPYREQPAGFFVDLEKVIQKIKALGFKADAINGAIRNLFNPAEEKLRRDRIMAELEQAPDGWHPPALHPNWHAIGNARYFYERIDKCSLLLQLMADAGKLCGITEEAWMLAIAKVFQDG